MATPASDVETGGVVIRSKSYLVKTQSQIEEGKDYRFSASGRRYRFDHGVAREPEHERSSGCTGSGGQHP